jgi:uncharacterized membrane protein YgaE (UPF0421/DUF939 family)
MVFTSIRAPRSPRLRSVATELRAELPAILQTIAAASLSYLAARYLPGRAGEPTFAPVAAIVAMTAAAGQRGRQAVLMVLGVAVGVSIANVLILVVGTGTWQLVVTMAVAMTAALLLRLGELVVAQAGIWAILIVSLPVPDLDSILSRLAEVAIGGAIALAFTQLLFPADPLRLASAAIRPLLDELAAVLEDSARALAERDEELAAAALAGSEDLDRRGAAEALRLARESSRRARTRRGATPRLREFERVFDELRTAGRDAVVLAVAAVRSVRSDEPVPAGLCDSLRELADAVRALSDALDRGEGFEEVVERAEAAAARVGSDELGETMSERLIAGQVQALAADVARASGRDEPA